MKTHRLFGAVVLASVGLALAGGPATASPGGSQPDLKIRRHTDAGDTGEGDFNTNGTQSLASNVGPGSSETWIVTVENAGAVPGRYEFTAAQNSTARSAHRRARSSRFAS